MKKLVLLIVLMLFPTFVKAEISPSFDCKKASTEVEKLICSNEELAKLDVEMNKSFEVLLSKIENPDFKIEVRKRYNKARDFTSIEECSNNSNKIKCLNEYFTKKIKFINRWIDMERSYFNNNIAFEFPRNYTRLYFYNNYYPDNSVDREICDIVRILIMRPENKDFVNGINDKLFIPKKYNVSRPEWVETDHSDFIENISDSLHFNSKSFDVNNINIKYYKTNINFFDKRNFNDLIFKAVVKEGNSISLGNYISKNNRNKYSEAFNDNYIIRNNTFGNDLLEYKNKYYVIYNYSVNKDVSGGYLGHVEVGLPNILLDEGKYRLAASRICPMFPLENGF